MRHPPPRISPSFLSERTVAHLPRPSSTLQFTPTLIPLIRLRLKLCPITSHRRAHVVSVPILQAAPIRPYTRSRAPALGLLCFLGIVSSVAALVIGFIPPSQFGHSNPVTYAVLILAGILAVGILPPLLMDRLRKPAWKAGGDGSAPQLSQER
jgi:hypothetical protein